MAKDGRWMELAQDRVQWQALVLAVLKLRVLLPQCQLFNIYSNAKKNLTFHFLCVWVLNV
jgi:hypothetical protein